jgi:hypothetical protein
VGDKETTLIDPNTKYIRTVIADSGAAQIKDPLHKKEVAPATREV